MKSIEVLGKSVDQAIEIGLFKLNTNKENVKIEVIDEGSLFNKAKIKMSLLENNEEESFIQNIVEEFLKKAKINCDVVVEQTEDCFNIDIFGDDSNLVIGKHGDCLNAIQNLLSQIILKQKGEYIKVLVDCSGYRSRREESLRILASRMANKAIKEKRAIKLEPMCAFDRRIIHTRLQDNSEVVTQSQGVEPNRFLVIYPKAKAPKNLSNEE